MKWTQNSKLGPSHIPNDPKEQSRNGKKLENLLEENDLVVVNGTDLCKGVITRKRSTINGTEESVIDFVLFSDDLIDNFKSFKVDEMKKHVLTKI